MCLHVLKYGVPIGNLIENPSRENFNFIKLMDFFFEDPFKLARFIYLFSSTYFIAAFFFANRMKRKIKIIFQFVLGFKKKEKGFFGLICKFHHVKSCRNPQT